MRLKTGERETVSDRQASISASRHASSVTAKAKLRHGRRLALPSDLNLIPNLCTLSRSVVGSSSSVSSSPHFTDCSSPSESASVFADYLRSHFSVFPAKTQRSRARGYLSELRRATCSEKSHSSFCSPFSPDEFLAAASNLYSSTTTGQKKVAYPMLKQLPRSGMDFLLHIFNLSRSLHSFHSIWKISFIIPIHKMGKPLDSPTVFQPISLTSCVSKLFKRIILSRLLFFLESNYILSLARPIFVLNGLLWIKFCFFLSPFRMRLTNPDRALERFSLLLTSQKLLTLSGTPPFSIISCRLASLLAFLVGFNLSFLIGVVAWFIKSQKSLFFSPSRGSARIRSWPCTFLSFHQCSSCFSAFYRQLLFLC